MEYEGKNKIIYIGTVVLAVVLFVLYGVYFIQQSQVKETTTNYAREVKNSNEEGLGVVLGTSALEIEEVIAEEQLPTEEVEEETPVEEVIIPVKKNNNRRNNVINSVHEYGNNEVVYEPVVEDNMSDQIIDTTQPEPVSEPEPEPVSEPEPEPAPIIEDEEIEE